MRPHMASPQGLAERAGGEEPDDRRVDRKQRDGRDEAAERAALEEDRFQDGEVVARWNEIGERPDGGRHLVDRKGEAREQGGRQHRRDEGDLARADLAADARRNEIAEAEHDDEEERRRQEQRRHRAAERRLEPEDGDDEAERGIEHADEEIGQDLAGHQLHPGDRRRHQHLHGAALPLARNGERRQLGADEGEHQRDDAGHDEVAADEVLVVPDAVLGDGRGDWRLLAKALRPLQLDIAGEGPDHRPRITERDVGGVVVGRVEDRLHGGGIGRREILREVRRDDDGHLAVAGVDRALDAVVVALALDDLKIERRLESLHHRLALLAALPVEQADLHVLDVEIDAVAEQRHLHERHQEHDHQAARIPQHLDDLLLGDRPDAAESHWAAPRAPSPPTSWTNTSSSVGLIGSILDQESPRSLRRASIAATSRAASSTTMCSDEPNGATSRAAGTPSSASRMAPGSSPSTSRISPRIALRYNSPGLPSAMSLPPLMSAMRLQYSASSM